jgi:hypothetical protein
MWYWITTFFKDMTPTNSIENYGINCFKSTIEVKFSWPTFYFLTKMKSSKQGNPKKLLGLCRFIRMGDSAALGIIFNRFDEISTYWVERLESRERHWPRFKLDRGLRLLLLATRRILHLLNLGRGKFFFNNCTYIE